MRTVRTTCRGGEGGEQRGIPRSAFMRLLGSDDKMTPAEAQGRRE